MARGRTNSRSRSRRGGGRNQGKGPRADSRGNNTNGNRRGRGNFSAKRGKSGPPENGDRGRNGSEDYRRKSNDSGGGVSAGGVYGAFNLSGGPSQGQNGSASENQQPNLTGANAAALNSTQSKKNDVRPDVERRKGGVKLFVGRVPQEAPEALIRKTFERFGQVLEVFKMRGERPGEERHSLYHEDGLTCAFVRMRDVPSAEDAIGRLHDQERLLPNRRDTGPIQVAYAKGEALRLGLESTREALPNRLEGKELVRQLKERLILDAPDQQSFKFCENGNPFWFPTDPLIDIINTGRKKDRMFESCWRHYCSEGWGGTYEIQPELMCHHGLVQFVMMRTVDYGDAEWFLNMVKATHNKLNKGELQSSQRRNLTADQCYAVSCNLSRPGDGDQPKDQDSYNVVARHAEIVRNRKLMEAQGVAPGQGMVAPGQGIIMAPGQGVPGGPQGQQQQGPGGVTGQIQQGPGIQTGSIIGVPGAPSPHVGGHGGAGAVPGPGVPHSTTPGNQQQQPVSKSSLPPPVHVPGLGVANATIQSEQLQQKADETAGGQAQGQNATAAATTQPTVVPQMKEDVDYSDI